MMECCIFLTNLVVGVDRWKQSIGFVAGRNGRACGSARA